MHAVTLQVLRTACRPLPRCACRIVGGSRHRLPRKHFHRSAITYRTPQDPPPTENEKEYPLSEDPNVEFDGAKAETEGADSSKSTQEIVDSLPLSQRAKNGKQGSTRARLARQRHPEGLPPVVLPDWFWKRNVKCIEDQDRRGTLAVFGERGLSNEVKGDSTVLDAEIARQSLDVSECELSPTESTRYSIHVDIYKEILATIRAGFALRPPKGSASQSILRPITLLQCPKDGGTFYLDSVVETVASKVDADLVRLDAQYIALIVGPYLDENLAWGLAKASLIGYEA